MQSLNLKAKGLHTANNELGSVPEGAMTVANDVDIYFDNVVESRRGLNRLSFALPNASDRVNRFFSFQDQLFAHFGDSTIGRYDTGSGWSSYAGTIDHPDDDLARVRQQVINQSLFLSSATGVKKLDAYTGTIAAAGMYRGLDVTGSLVAGSFFTTANQVAYRVVWGYRDANNVVVLGSPSQRCVVTNGSGSSKDVQLIITIPTGITTSHFFQIYRSGLSGSATVEPNDELGLVYEANPTSGEITAKSITVTDSTPDSLRGATIYTAPSQEGLAQSNDAPPICRDFCVFRDHTIYVNITSKQRKVVTILAVGSPNGVQANDVITIDGITYTGKASENVSNREFAIVTAGTPAQNIADTAASLIRVINQSAANTTVYATYLSNVNELPGKILLEERGLGGSSFAIIASGHGSAYNPPLPTSGTTVSSSNNRFLNGVYTSKAGQPEAVPIENLDYAGAADQEALRVIALRDSCFILKEDGVYRITGTDITNFEISLFDNTARILAPDSAVVLNNQIWCLTDQGVVSISDTGVVVRSRPIENQILELFGLTLSTVKSKTFGVAYETDRKYMLWTVSNDTDTYPTQAFIYNLFTNTWTRYVLSKTAGFVNPVDNKLYLGDAVTSNVNYERKDYSYTDYIDEGSSYTLVSNDDYEIVLSESVADIEVGDLLYQSSSVRSVITDIDVVNRTLTVENDLSGWSAGAVTVYKAIPCEVQWSVNPAGNPGELHHFSEAILLMKSFRAFATVIGFASDISSGFEDIELSQTNVGLWGFFPWGSLPWGAFSRPKALRTYVPAMKQRCSQINVRLLHRVAYSQWKVQGLSLKFRSLSNRVTRG